MKNFFATSSRATLEEANFHPAQSLSPPLQRVVVTVSSLVVMAVQPATIPRYDAFLARGRLNNEGAGFTRTG